MHPFQVISSTVKRIYDDRTPNSRPVLFLEALIHLDYKDQLRIVYVIIIYRLGPTPQQEGKKWMMMMMTKGSTASQSSPLRLIIG